MFFRDSDAKSVTDPVTDHVPDKTSQTHVAVLELLKENPVYSREEMAASIGKTVRTIQRALNRLSAEGWIRRVGNARTGYWEILRKGDK